jgi:hypothetical protein
VLGVPGFFKGVIDNGQVTGVAAISGLGSALFLLGLNNIGVVVVPNLLGVTGFECFVFSGVNVAQIAYDVHVFMVTN